MFQPNSSVFKSPLINFTHPVATPPFVCRSSRLRSRHPCRRHEHNAASWNTGGVPKGGIRLAAEPRPSRIGLHRNGADRANAHPQSRWRVGSDTRGSGFLTEIVAGSAAMGTHTHYTVPVHASVFQEWLGLLDPDRPVLGPVLLSSSRRRWSATARRFNPTISILRHPVSSSSRMMSACIPSCPST